MSGQSNGRKINFVKFLDCCVAFEVKALPNRAILLDLIDLASETLVSLSMCRHSIV